MKLLDLPVDIINILPNYFNSIYDLYNVLLTCRTLHTAYHDSEIKLPPILPKPDGQPLFQTHPHLLITSVARQIGDWAVSSPSNRYELYQTLVHGYDGLLSLAEKVAFVSLLDLRHLHEIKYSVLSPLTRLVDFEVGPAMVRNQDIDPADYGLTICLCPDIAVMNHVVYCELFHHYVDEILASAELSATKESSGRYYRDSAIIHSVEDLALPEITKPKASTRPLEAGIRHQFIAYCLPDPNNCLNKAYNSLGKGRDDEWQLLDYLEMSRSNAVRCRDEALRRYWNTGELMAIPEHETVGYNGHERGWQPSTAEKREALFVLVAGHLGYESLQMLLLDGMSGEKLVTRMKDLRAKVKAIPDFLIDRWQYRSRNNLAEPAPDNPSKDESYGKEWYAWQGMDEDCGDGINANSGFVEDLRDEAEACESLLKLNMSAHQLGVMDAVAQELAKH
jgi:hypothetical protein